MPHLGGKKVKKESLRYRAGILIFMCLVIFLLCGNVTAVQAAVTSAETVETASDGTFEPTEKGWIYTWADGTKAQDCLLLIEGKTYLFSEEGIRQYGWQKLGKKWYYFGTRDQGYMHKNTWVRENGKKTSYLLKDGSRCQGWYNGKNIYYFDKSSIRIHIYFLDKSNIGSCFIISDDCHLV